MSLTSIGLGLVVAGIGGAIGGSLSVFPNAKEDALVRSYRRTVAEGRSPSFEEQAALGSLWARRLGLALSAVGGILILIDMVVG